MNARHVFYDVARIDSPNERKVMHPSKKLQPRDRLPIAITRFIRATYGPPGKTPPYYLGFKPHNWKLLATPLIESIELIPAHDHEFDCWGSYACCFGATHVIKVTYAAEGYGCDIGAHFDFDKDRWVFSVWAD